LGEDVCAFGGVERFETVGEGLGDRIEGSWRLFSDEAFELGEDLLDRVEIGRIFWQEDKPRADIADSFSSGLSFVLAEIVEDHDISPCLRIGTRNCST
jgi:hypothetical protein